MSVRFKVTPWIDGRELVEVRSGLFGRGTDGTDNGRERSMNKILAWRLRKLELPLLLESTADLVDTVLLDEKGSLPHSALRLVYASAISRFITGLADTQTELSRNRPSWFPSSKTIQFPTSLRETRHRIVHRHLPSLAELKRAAKECLEWLWEWYWSHLDAALAAHGPAREGLLSKPEVKKSIEAVLKSYVKERKNEVKNKKPVSKAAESALSSISFVDADGATKRTVLLDLLVEEKAILPADKKLGTSMSGAFLIWSPLLRALSSFTPAFLQTFLDRVINIMSSFSHSAIDVEVDPIREGMHDWMLHILSSDDWRETRQAPTSTQKRPRADEYRLSEHALARCHTSPTFWTLKLAEELLKDEALPGRKLWLEMLDAAKAADEMDIDPVAAVGEEEMEVEAMHTAAPLPATKQDRDSAKLRGPQKRVGLWKPQPIGMIPKGWELDE